MITIDRNAQHKTLTDWARQMVLQVRHWLPDRALVLVADSSFAALELLAALLGQGVICVTRLRLDAALYEPAQPRRRRTPGRPPTKGRRLPKLANVLTATTTNWQRVRVSGWYGERDRIIEFCSATAVWRHAGLPVVPIRWVLVRDPLGRFDPQALLCTDPACEPLQILIWYVRRWQVEVTFREVRDHLGVETQRQWSDLAIARTTPCLLALFSLVTLLAARLDPGACRVVATAAWYHKPHPTFADTLAAPEPVEGPAAVLAGTGFLHIPFHSGGAKTPTGAPRSHCPRALLCGIAPSEMAKVELRGNSESATSLFSRMSEPGGRVRQVWRRAAASALTLCSNIGDYATP